LTAINNNIYHNENEFPIFTGIFSRSWRYSSR